jgi:phospholipase/lecithinase/hemolysin
VKIKFLFFLLLCCLLNVAYAYDRLVVFGDSLSDNGNVYKLTSSVHSYLYFVPIIPKNPPYYEGRFSNGPVWVEDLAQLMNIPLDDYAYGGAWAEPLQDSGLLFPFDLEMQVNFYLASTTYDYNKADHLYIVWSGANDYVHGTEAPDDMTTRTVDVIKDQIDWIIYDGARHFLIMNMPDLAVVPESRAEGPDFMDRVHQMSILHNTKLAAMINQEMLDHPDVTFIQGDTMPYFNDIIANPTKYGLKNATDACYGGNYWLLKKLAANAEIAATQKMLHIDLLHNPSLKEAYLIGKFADDGGEPCDNPDDYLFWDHIHPTRVVHRLMAIVVYDLLTKDNNNVV